MEHFFLFHLVRSLEMCQLRFSIQIGWFDAHVAFCCFSIGFPICFYTPKFVIEIGVFKHVLVGNHVLVWNPLDF